MFLEEVHVLEDRRSSVFYGPFDSKQSREIFKMLAMANHKLFWKIRGAKSFSNNIKYVSIGTLPKGEYKQLPMGFAGLSMWISLEDFENAHKIQIVPRHDQ